MMGLCNGSVFYCVLVHDMEFFHWFNSCLLQCYVSLSDRPAGRVGLSSIQSGQVQNRFLGREGSFLGGLRGRLSSSRSICARMCEPLLSSPVRVTVHWAGGRGF